MALNKVKPGSDMYQFLNDYPHENANRGYTWNIVKGQCPHLCEYCFMRRFKLNPCRFDVSELKTDLGVSNFIFVGSSNDMWAESVPVEWIGKTLNHINKFPESRYLFQSKNPFRFKYFQYQLAGLSLANKIDVVLGTTIETNRDYHKSQAPNVEERADAIRHFSKSGWDTFITVEPIMDFDFDELVELITWASPKIVHIGADSKGHNLPEPSWDKVEKLIEILSRDFKVVQKSNLKRLKRRY